MSSRADKIYHAATRLTVLHLEVLWRWANGSHTILSILGDFLSIIGDFLSILGDFL